MSHKHNWVEFKKMEIVYAIKCTTCNKVSYPNKNFGKKRQLHGSSGKPPISYYLDLEEKKEKVKSE